MAIFVKGVTLLHDKYPSAEHYPFDLPLFQKTITVDLDAPVTIFVGENGTGKSTLLEAIARACNIHIWNTSKGTRLNPNIYEEILHYFMKLEWTGEQVPGAYFGSEVFNDFRNLLDVWASLDPGQLEFFGGESLVTKSHGQSMMSYFRSRYQRKGVYLLDEPETALSPKSQLELLDIIKENSKNGTAQFILATHSPILMSCEGAQIKSFDEIPVKNIDYHDTVHYQVYKSFLNNH